VERCGSMILLMLVMTCGGCDMAQSTYNGDLVVQGKAADVYGPVYSILNYGAVSGGNSSTNTTAIQAAIDAARAAGGGTVYVPRGTYTVEAGGVDTLHNNLPYCLIIRNTGGEAPVKIIGDGKGSIIQAAPSVDANLLLVACDNAVILEDFKIAFTSVCTDTYPHACIHVTDYDNNGRNGESRMTNLRVDYGYYGIHFERAAYWRCYTCSVQGNYYCAFYVENLNNIDENDARIHACLIVGGGSDATCAADGAGVYYTSGGGLWITDTKFLCRASPSFTRAYQYGVHIKAGEGFEVATDNLHSWGICNNSIEGNGLVGGVQGHGIYIEDDIAAVKNGVIVGNATGDIHLAGSGSLKVYDLVIVGNRLGGSGVEVPYGIVLNCADYINITGNEFYNDDDGMPYGIYAGSGGYNFASGNTFYGYSNWSDTVVGNGIRAGYMGYAVDNSSDWYSDIYTGLTIANHNTSGDAVLKLLGATTGRGRIVYGVGTDDDELRFSSRQSGTSGTEYVSIDHDANLYVGGNITCGGSCDYVFEEGYELPSLEELREHINTYNKLPGLVEPDKVAMKDLMEKTEEQALYILQLHDRIEKLEQALLNKE
jgi:hypothetical protein